MASDPNSSQFRLELATAFADQMSKLANDLDRSRSELKQQETEPDMQVEEVGSPLTPEQEKPEKPEELVKTEEPEKEEPQEKDKPPWRKTEEPQEKDEPPWRKTSVHGERQRSLEKDEPVEKEEPEKTEELLQMRQLIRAAKRAEVALPVGRLEGASAAEQIRQQLEKISEKAPLSKGLVRPSSEAGLSSQPGEPVVISARQGYPNYQGPQQPAARGDLRSDVAQK